MEEVKSTIIEEKMKEDLEVGTELLKVGDIAEFLQEEKNIDRIIKFLTAAKSVKELEESWIITWKLLNFMEILAKVILACGVVLSAVALLWFPIPSTPFWCRVELFSLLAVASVAFIFAPLASNLIQSFMEVAEPKLKLYRDLSKRSQKVIDAFGGQDTMTNTIVSACPNIADRADQYVEELKEKWGVK